MTAKILDGEFVAKIIKDQIKWDLDKRAKSNELYSPFIPPPCLAVVLCTNDPASELYVKNKQKACKEVGINSFVIRPFEAGIENWFNPMNHLLSVIDWLNTDDSVHGILVQLPLPKILDQFKVFDRISVLKDVDCFSPVNVGLLLQGRPRFIPCTPAGIQEMLRQHQIQIEGKKFVIINRSDIVGKPLNSLLIQNNKEANATVTLCHDHTPPETLKEICLASDIIVVAVGKPKFLTADMVTEKSIVVDVGINRVDGKIVGDADFEKLKEKVAWISTVPKGVGLTTVSCLLNNVWKAQGLQR